MERQPTRSKRVREDRRFDKTQLRASGHGRTVHRDYGAHVLRWNFVAEEMLQPHLSGSAKLKATEIMLESDRLGEVEAYVPDYLRKIFFRYGWVARQVKQGMKILDVGCGQDQPLLYVLGARIQTVPELYVGVDLNRISKKSGVRWAKIYDEYDFIKNFDTQEGGRHHLSETHGHFDTITCFEVIEHMSSDDGRTLLSGLRACLADRGRLYLSTPVFDGMAAANHIHEWKIGELQEAIEQAGFVVERRLGTFASKPDIRHAMRKAGREDHLKAYDELEQWFGGDVMSCFMAPLYPDASRNNLWVCKKP
jgi:2-polyprenyl-3-methyl-5-hydroxy-6-metoxy-1,4-benzoquinol methylase